MKNDIFRPVNFWKSAVMSMPDNSFFELLRSVSGKIKTPFNKQQLLNNLESFLLRDDIQKTISSYIDENDAKIIAAIAVIGEPIPEQLGLFFSDEYSYAKLLDIIVNLEERFIIYRFTEDKTNSNENSKSNINRLALNPVLKTILQNFTSDTSVLFPLIQKQPAAGKQSARQSAKIIIGDLILAGFLSFVSQWKPFYKNDNTNRSCIIRKRVLDAGKLCFPGLDLDSFAGSLLVLGLFYTDENNLIPDRKRIDDFSKLTVRERSIYYAASILIYRELPPSVEILPPLFRSRIRDIVNLISGFLELLKKDLFYPENTLRRMVEVIKAQTNISINAKTLLETLEKAGLISVTKNITNLVIPGETKTDVNSPVIAIDSGYSILVYPEINIIDVITLASFMNIRESSAPFIRFDLDKDSAVRAFNNNMNADEIIRLLGRLAGDKTNFASAENILSWNLKDWEKRYKEVSLKKGIVLNLSEKHRYLTETGPLSALITETLAPGLYLVDENSIEETRIALNNAGIDIIAQRQIKKEKTSGTVQTSLSNYFPQPSAPDLPLLIPDSLSSVKTGKNNQTSVQTAELHAILNDLQISETEKAELSARINRRLILCEAQLKEADIRYEKLEARHMDYTGKQNIAKQAIAQQSPVEIIWPGKGNSAEGEKIFGIPKALEKEGNDLFLVVDLHAQGQPSILDSDNLLRLPLAKISLLRRIKKSIFEK